jgi:DNA-binding transcriptional MerR regulator
MKAVSDFFRFRPAPAETNSEDPSQQPEYSIDELARESGTTVRNVRAYQERGLLPPPQRRGRSGVYTQSHAGRLRVIARLLERGYSLANIGELIALWEGGHDIGQLLGLEAALTSPWSDETAVIMTGQELLGLFGGNLDADTLARYLALGFLKKEGDRFLVQNPKLIQMGAALVREGVPLVEFLAIIEELRGGIERAANQFVQLIVKHVFDRYGKDRLPPPDAVPHLADLVWRMRPMAMQAVEAEAARAMELAANRHLGERLAHIMSHLRGTPKDEPPAQN